MTIQNAVEQIIDKLGRPVGDNGVWISWRCPQCDSPYNSYLFNRNSGWQGCNKCGYKLFKGAGVQRQPPAPTPQFVAAPVVTGEPSAYCPVTDIDILKYLEARGLRQEEIDLWVRQREDVIDHEWAYFPIIEDDFMVSWHARSIRDDNYARWISPPQRDGWLSPNSCVWGIDRIVAGQPVYVCEGIFDALYFPTGVAVMHDMVEPIQAMKILDRLPSRVMIAFDRDQTHWIEDVARVFRALDRYVETGSITPHLKDWGEYVQDGGRYA